MSKNDHDGNLESRVIAPNDNSSLASGSDGDGRDDSNNNIIFDPTKQKNEDCDDDDFIPRAIADFLHGNSLEHQFIKCRFAFSSSIYWFI